MHLFNVAVAIQYLVPLFKTHKKTNKKSKQSVHSYFLSVHTVSPVCFFDAGKLFHSQHLPLSLNDELLLPLPNKGAEPKG